MEQFILETVDEQPIYEKGRKVRTEKLKGTIIKIDINFYNGDVTAVGKYYTDINLIKDIIFSIPDNTINMYVAGYNKLAEYENTLFLDKITNITYDLFIIEFSKYFDLQPSQINKIKI